MMRRTLVFLVWALSVRAAFAQPSVIGVSGTLAHGAAITISGSGFGVKSPAAPVVYDDFQGVAVGANVLTSGKWTDDQGFVKPVADNGHIRSGTPFTRNMKSHWPSNTGDSPSSGRQSGDVSNVRKVFASTTATIYFDAWMFMALESGTSPQNVKPWRANTSGAVSANIYNQGTGVSDSGAGQRDGVAVVVPTSPTWNGGFSSSGGGGNDAALPGSAWYDRWTHWQWLVKAGSPTGEDGSLVIYVDGVKRVSRVGNISMMNSGLTGWDYIYVGNYVRADAHGPTSTYWESVYIDSSWARVEIGNHSNYAKATHREILTPSAWSASSITATLNRGSFGTSANAYIYVCASDNACSSGFAVTLGSVSSTPPRRIRRSQALNALSFLTLIGACIVVARSRGRFGQALRFRSEPSPTAA